MSAAPATSPLLGVYKRAPMEIVRGEGVRLYDAEGKAYIDFTAGIGVNALGYADAGVQAALRDAADGLLHVSNLFRTAPGERLAARLVELSFADQVFFCNSGAEANEGAFKFARRWARSLPDGNSAKHEILALRGSFHGRLMGTLAATDRANYRAPFRPLAGGIRIVERDINDLAVAMDPETVAAVIVEPIQGESGVRVIDAAFLRDLRALADERKAALIFDEIQCGLSRTGYVFAYQASGITPDILTLAKPLAGGLPMGAILVTDEIARTLQPGDHGSTFGGGPFVASVALHVLERLSDHKLGAHVRSLGEWLGRELEAMTERTGAIRAVRGRGLMWGIDVGEPASEVIARARAHGLLLVSAGEYTVRLLPPLVISREDLAQGLALLEGALRG
ncbi:MAG TPA: acetylornithine transaminase [Gemmatimonadaceae bacterium]|nr:acetylornithine transaminase [Gemmatimonadaceae bacterium]